MKSDKTPFGAVPMKKDDRKANKEQETADAEESENDNNTNDQE